MTKRPTLRTPILMKSHPRVALMAAVLAVLVGAAVLAPPAYAATGLTVVSPGPLTNAVDYITGIPSCGLGPVGMNTSGTTVLVTDYCNATTYKYDTSSGTPVLASSLTNGLTHAIAVDSSGVSFGVASNNQSVTPAGVWMFSRNTLQLERQVAQDPCGDIRGLASDPSSGDLLLSGDCGLFRIHGLDTLTPSLAPLVSGDFDGIAIDSSSGVIWAALNGNNLVNEYDLKTGAMLASVPVAGGPDGIAFAAPGSPGGIGGNLFVNVNNGTIVMIDVHVGNATSVVAQGGGRGDFVYVGPDGFLYVTQPDSIVQIQPAIFVPANPGTPAIGIAVSPTAGTPMTTFHTTVTGSCPNHQTQLVLVLNPITNSVLTGSQILALSDVDFKLQILGTMHVEVTCDLVVASSADITVNSASYVALGDSYSSGEGQAAENASSYEAGTNFPDGDPGMHGILAGCHRANKGWARGIGAAYVRRYPTMIFAACSGAGIADLYGTNTHYSQEHEGAQLASVSPTATRLVTMSMGGNDVGFPEILKACVYSADGAPSATGAKGCHLPTSQIYQATRTNLNRLQAGGVATANGSKTLHQMYVDVASRITPGGKLIVAGYPELFGPGKGKYVAGPRGQSTNCQVGTAAGGIPIKGGTYLVDYDDAQWISGLSREGNDIIQREIHIANKQLAQARSTVTVVYADVLKQFGRHSLCDAKDSWINGLQIDTANHYRKQASFHPNPSGQLAYQRAAAEQM